MVPITGTRTDPLDIETKDHSRETIPTLGLTLEIIVVNLDQEEKVEILEETRTDVLLAILEIETETKVLGITGDMTVNLAGIAHTADPNLDHNLGTDALETIKIVSIIM